MSQTPPPAAPEIVEVPSEFGPIEGFRGDRITEHVRLWGNHCRPEFAFAQAPMDARMNVFDLGCHIGTFSLGVLRRLGAESRLLAVEGMEATLRLARRNLARRGGARVEVVQGFVGSGDRAAMVMRQTGSDMGVSRLVRSAAPEQGVETVSLDMLAERHFVPDYIKIDVEGAEFAAFSSSEMIARHRPILYAEMAVGPLREFGHTMTDVNDLLSDLGYAFFVNIGERNATHDFWKAGTIERIDRYETFFDVLCIPRDSAKAQALLKIAEPIPPRDPAV